MLESSSGPLDEQKMVLTTQFLGQVEWPKPVIPELRSRKIKKVQSHFNYKLEASLAYWRPYLYKKEKEKEKREEMLS